MAPPTPPPRSFELDDFQVEAIAHIENGNSVVVSAPTGSGKTFVAEHALHRAQLAGLRGLYTTPIKALSNQKFRDLSAWLGSEDVGLLTGDNSINGDGSAVVMTTEVLRNMLYTEPARLDDVGVVVMDEVHYLQDNYRGPVWEEVIIHLPDHVQLVALSATVSNASELAAWISEVHRPCEPVTEITRPVALYNHYFVADKKRAKYHLIGTLDKRRRPNPDGRRFDLAEPRRRGRAKQGPRPPRPFRTPRRSEVIDELHRRGMLPAITFIFSRAGCDDAVSALRSEGVELTTTAEAQLIADHVEERTAHLSDGERRALEFDRWRRGLVAGIAAHHAGIVPLFKEIVEELFTAGLLRAVFATETLALGVNMPARTVVIERLTKFTGEHHEALTPSDYTQLTGRAGRRGIDDRGHAVVLWSPFVTFGDVAALAQSRSFELRSAFRPTYNMTCHLVSRYTRGDAEALISRSFGQYQADAAVADMTSRRDRIRARLDVDDSLPIAASAEQSAEIAASLSALRPGDVIDVGPTVAVLSTAWRRKRVQVRTIDRDGQIADLDPEALLHAPAVVGRVSLPEPFNPTSSSHQHDIVGALRATKRTSKGKRQPRHEPVAAGSPWVDESARNDRRELARLDRRIAERRGRLTDRFRSVVGLLSELGYIDRWSLTERGTVLVRTFHELDLVIVESLRAGHLDGHGPAGLAGLVSAFVHQPRRGDADPEDDPWFPSEAIRSSYEGIAAVAEEVRRLESAYGLPESRDVDPGLIAAAHGWAAGGGLGDILSEDDLAGGDFVRQMRQVVDVLLQLSVIAPETDTRRQAAAAVQTVRRGIVDAQLLDADASIDGATP